MDKFTTTDVKVNTETGTEQESFTSADVNTKTVNEVFTDSIVNNQPIKEQEQNILTSDTVKSDKSNNVRKYNVQNLKPVKTKKEARERGRNGGIKSGETRRQKKTMRETLENALKIELSQEKLSELGADISLMNGETSVLAAIIASTVREAINGDTKAIQFVRDSIGEKPVDETINHTEIVTKEDTELMDNLRNSLIS